jgi:hypothetical protein
MLSLGESLQPTPVPAMDWYARQTRSRLVSAAKQMIASLGDDRVAIDAASILMDFVDLKVGRKPVHFNS